MIHLSVLRGDRIQATDGTLGSLKDLYFDAAWSVRYLVVDTGGWLPARQVLVAPALVRAADDDAVCVELTCEQLKHGPSVAGKAARTQEFEEELARSSGQSDEVRESDAEPVEPTAVESKLASAADVVGCRIEAADGPIGHVEDLLIDESRWRIADMIVETRNWLPGKKVAVPPSAVESIDWTKGTVRLRLRRADVKAAPEARA